MQSEADRLEKVAKEAARAARKLRAKERRRVREMLRQRERRKRAAIEKRKAAAAAKRADDEKRAGRGPLGAVLEAARQRRRDRAHGGTEAGVPDPEHGLPRVPGLRRRPRRRRLRQSMNC